MSSFFICYISNLLIRIRRDNNKTQPRFACRVLGKSDVPLSLFFHVYAAISLIIREIYEATNCFYHDKIRESEFCTCWLDEHSKEAEEVDFARKLKISCCAYSFRWRYTHVQKFHLNIKHSLDSCQKRVNMTTKCASKLFFWSLFHSCEFRL